MPHYRYVAPNYATTHAADIALDRMEKCILGKSQELEAAAKSLARLAAEFHNHPPPQPAAASPAPCTVRCSRRNGNGGFSRWPTSPAWPRQGGATAGLPSSARTTLTLPGVTVDDDQVFGSDHPSPKATALLDKPAVAPGRRQATPGTRAPKELPRLFGPLPPPAPPPRHPQLRPEPVLPQQPHRATSRPSLGRIPARPRQPISHPTGAGDWRDGAVEDTGPLATLSCQSWWLVQQCLRGVLLSPCTAPPSHRKRVKHFHAPGHVHELTFSCYRREPLLATDLWRTMLARSIQRANVRHAYRLIAFVFMPEHVHLLVAPGQDSAPIDAYLKAVKRPFSYHVKQHLAATDDELLGRLTIRQRPGVQTFRFWQEGPGYDRNLTSREVVLAAMDYVHLNPVRRGLCSKAAHWRWSSAGYYLLNDAPCDPDLPSIDGLPAQWLDPTGVQIV